LEGSRNSMSRTRWPLLPRGCHRSDWSLRTRGTLSAALQQKCIIAIFRHEEDVRGWDRIGKDWRSSMRLMSCRWCLMICCVGSGPRVFQKVRERTVCRVHASQAFRLGGNQGKVQEGSGRGAEGRELFSSRPRDGMRCSLRRPSSPALRHRS
jgi:hypothetical protein